MMIFFQMTNVKDMVEKSELEIWSLQISTFQRSPYSQLQPPYFRLCK
jgi:hypothetical protein